MSAPPKKQATKGQKQIAEENGETLKLYLAFSAVGTLIHVVCMLALFADPPTTWHKVFFELSSMLCMRMMAKVTLGDKGQMLDAGLDLNFEGGFGEYCKDIVILTTIVQVLATFSHYAWFLALAIPAYASFKLWTGVISPWVFAEAPVESEADQKRRAKKERKVKRI